MPDQIDSDRAFLYFDVYTNTMEENALQSAILQLQYYKSLGDKTFAQLTESDIHWTTDPSQNSIAIIINHLTGNMLSRWTNILEEDGEKDWRNRDQEFEPILKTKADMLAYWEKGWDCLFGTLESLSGADMQKITYIRNQGHTVWEAIARQLCHYSYHIGQIVLLGKMIRKDDWSTLSIAKNASESYNAERFSRDVEVKHFTVDV